MPDGRGRGVIAEAGRRQHGERVVDAVAVGDVPRFSEKKPLWTLAANEIAEANSRPTNR